MSHPTWVPLGVAGTGLGRLALLAYGWVEATFGPTQNKPDGTPDDPVLALLSIEFLSFGLLCLALTLRGLLARFDVARTASRASWLCTAASILFPIGGLLWVPLWLGETAQRMVFGPIAGGVRIFAMLSLLAGAALVSRWAMHSPTLLRLVRLAPLTLLVLLVLMWAVVSLLGPWHVVAALYVPFLAAWLVLGRAECSGDLHRERQHLP